MIKIDIINKTGFKIDQEGITEYLKNAGQVRYPDNEAYIEIVAVSQDEISQLNKDYLQRVGSTDVISFPNANPDNDKHISLGSIVFSPEYLNIHHESDIQVVEHGFLHLMGLDHENNQADWNKKLTELRHDISKLSN